MLRGCVEALPRLRRDCPLHQCTCFESRETSEPNHVRDSVQSLGSPRRRVPLDEAAADGVASRCLFLRPGPAPEAPSAQRLPSSVASSGAGGGSGDGASTGGGASLLGAGSLRLPLGVGTGAPRGALVAAAVRLVLPLGSVRAAASGFEIFFRTLPCGHLGRSSLAAGGTRLPGGPPSPRPPWSISGCSDSVVQHPSKECSDSSSSSDSVFKSALWGDDCAAPPSASRRGSLPDLSLSPRAGSTGPDSALEHGRS